jgi:hypothetical protein
MKMDSEIVFNKDTNQPKEKPQVQESIKRPEAPQPREIKENPNTGSRRTKG